MVTLDRAGLDTRDWTLWTGWDWTQEIGHCGQDRTGLDTGDWTLWTERDRTQETEHCGQDGTGHRRLDTVDRVGPDTGD